MWPYINTLGIVLILVTLWIAIPILVNQLRSIKQMNEQQALDIVAQVKAFIEAEKANSGNVSANLAAALTDLAATAQ